MAGLTATRDDCRASSGSSDRPSLLTQRYRWLIIHLVIIFDQPEVFPANVDKGLIAPSSRAGVVRLASE